MGLSMNHLHFHEDFPMEFGILWLQLTKDGKTSPWSAKNMTHVVLRQTPWDVKVWNHLRSLASTDPVHALTCWGQVYHILKNLPSPLNRLTGHSFKSGAGDEINRLQSAIPDLPTWAPSMLMKHANAGTDEIPDQRVRYARDKFLVITKLAYAYAIKVTVSVLY